MANRTLYELDIDSSGADKKLASIEQSILSIGKTLQAAFSKLEKELAATIEGGATSLGAAYPEEFFNSLDRAEEKLNRVAGLKEKFAELTAEMTRLSSITERLASIELGLGDLGFQVSAPEVPDLAAIVPEQIDFSGITEGARTDLTLLVELLQRLGGEVTDFQNLWVAAMQNLLSQPAIAQLAQDLVTLNNTVAEIKTPEDIQSFVTAFELLQGRASAVGVDLNDLIQIIGPLNGILAVNATQAIDVANAYTTAQAALKTTEVAIAALSAQDSRVAELVTQLRSLAATASAGISTPQGFMEFSQSLIRVKDLAKELGVSLPALIKDLNLQDSLGKLDSSYISIIQTLNKEIAASAAAFEEANASAKLYQIGIASLGARSDALQGLITDIKQLSNIADAGIGSPDTFNLFIRTLAAARDESKALGVDIKSLAKEAGASDAALSLMSSSLVKVALAASEADKEFLALQDRATAELQAVSSSAAFLVSGVEAVSATTPALGNLISSLQQVAALVKEGIQTPDSFNKLVSLFSTASAEASKLGVSVTSFASQLGISKDTIALLSSPLVQAALNMNKLATTTTQVGAQMVAASQGVSLFSVGLQALGAINPQVATLASSLQQINQLVASGVDTPEAFSQLVTQVSSAREAANGLGVSLVAMAREAGLSKEAIAVLSNSMVRLGESIQNPSSRLSEMQQLLRSALAVLASGDADVATFVSAIDRIQETFDAGFADPSNFEELITLFRQASGVAEGLGTSFNALAKDAGLSNQAISFLNSTTVSLAQGLNQAQVALQLFINTAFRELIDSNPKLQNIVSGLKALQQVIGSGMDLSNTSRANTLLAELDSEARKLGVDLITLAKGTGISAEAMAYLNSDTARLIRTMNQAEEQSKRNANSFKKMFAAVFGGASVASAIARIFRVIEANISRAIRGAIRFTSEVLEIAKSFEVVEIALQAAFSQQLGNQLGKAVGSAMALEIRKQSEQVGASLEEVYLRLLPRVSGVEQAKQIAELIPALQASNPFVAPDRAINSMLELIAGQTESLRRTFNIPVKQIGEAYRQFGLSGAIEALTEELSAQGLLIEQQAESANLLKNQFTQILITFKQIAGIPALDELVVQLRKVQEYIDANRKDLELFFGQLGRVLGQVFTEIGDILLPQLGELDIQELIDGALSFENSIVSISESLQKMILFVETAQSTLNKYNPSSWFEVDPDADGAFASFFKNLGSTWLSSLTDGTLGIKTLVGEYKEFADALSDPRATTALADLGDRLSNIGQRLPGDVGRLFSGFGGLLSDVSALNEKLGEFGTSIVDIPYWGGVFASVLAGMGGAAQAFGDNLKDYLLGGTSGIEFGKAIAEGFSVAQQGFVDSEIIPYLEEHKRITEEATAKTEANNQALEDQRTALEELRDAEMNAADAALARNRVLDLQAAIGENLATIQEKQISLAKEIADRKFEIELDYARKLIDVELDLARKREDIAQDLVDKLRDIEQEYRNDQIDAERDYNRDLEDLEIDAQRKIEDIDLEAADKRLEIEKEYRRKLEDLVRKFNFDAQEAIRDQDAIRFLELRRKLQFDIVGAGIDRDRALEDIDSELRQKIEQNALDRQRDEEDARRSYDRKLEDLLISYQREKEAAAQAAEDARRDAQLDYERDREDALARYNEALEDFARYVKEKTDAFMDATREERDAIKIAQNEIATLENTGYKTRLANLDLFVARYRATVLAAQAMISSIPFGMPGSNINLGTGDITVPGPNINTLRAQARSAIAASSMSDSEKIALFGEVNRMTIEDLIALITELTGAAPMAKGGRFRSGQQLLVGEGGPELVQFDRPGRVIPNRLLPDTSFSIPTIPNKPLTTISTVNNNTVDFSMLDPSNFTAAQIQILNQTIASVVIGLLRASA